MKKVNGRYLFVLNAYWIGLSFMWNSLHVTILPAVLLNYVPETQKNTWLGLLTFFGLDPCHDHSAAFRRVKRPLVFKIWKTPSIRPSRIRR